MVIDAAKGIEPQTRKLFEVCRLRSVPIITFLYQRGEFTALTTQMVAWALVWYASGLVFHAIQEVLVRAYYAMHDTRTPVLVGAAAMLLSIAFSLLFSYSFTQLGWMPHGGLALAVSVSTGLEVLTLLFLMRKRLHGLQERQIAAAFGAALLGTAIMTAGLLFWLEWLRSASPLLLALGGVVVGASLYGLTILPLRLPELNALFQAVKRRLTR